MIGVQSQTRRMASLDHETRTSVVNDESAHVKQGEPHDQVGHDHRPRHRLIFHQRPHHSGPGEARRPDNKEAESTPAASPAPAPRTRAKCSNTVSSCALRSPAVTRWHSNGEKPAAVKASPNLSPAFTLFERSAISFSHQSFLQTFQTGANRQSRAHQHGQLLVKTDTMPQRHFSTLPEDVRLGEGVRKK